MERLVERFSDRTRDAHCSRLTLPNVPIGSHNCLVIVFSCPVKRFDSIHPETKTDHVFSIRVTKAQVLPFRTDMLCNNGFKCSVHVKSLDSNENTVGWTFMSVEYSNNSFEVEPFDTSESSHKGVSFGHISDKNVQGTEITNQRCHVAFATLRGTQR